MEQAEIAPNSSVSSLELFFDLVLVFTITQITQLIVLAQSWPDYLHAILILIMVWWMYGGYAWLTNNLRMEKPGVRLLLLVAMACFLILAILLPHTFDYDGTWFGLTYLVIVAIHAMLFSVATNTAAAQSIRRVAPYSMAASGLIMLTGFIGDPWNLLLWAAAVLLLATSSLKRREQGFTLYPAHFVERHGLVVLIILGESMVAVGSAAASDELSSTTIAAALLGLVICTAIWWSYFGEGNERAEQALTKLSIAQRSLRAVYGYGYAHLLIIAGIIVLAAGLRQVIIHNNTSLPVVAALHLAGGVTLFLVGDIIFRSILGIQRISLAYHLAVVLVLCSVFFGSAQTGIQQLVLIAAILIGAAIFEHKKRKKSKAEG